MSSLQVGIVGLPNAGKSTLFNALASRRLAETAARPFTTIEPHEAVVAIPDKDLESLSKLVKPEKTVPASVTFIDIAGLVKGAHKGEGLGNQFLGKIREVDAIVHVVRAFTGASISHQHPSHEPGSPEQVIEDIKIVNLELELGEITGKPVIYVLNVEEYNLNDGSTQRLANSVKEKFKEEAVAISAKLEEELIDLEKEERVSYLAELGIEKTGLELLIQKTYFILELLTFYTIKPSSAKASEGHGGGTTVTAWSLKKGSNAVDAAAEVHTDFAKKFIKAEVINIEELLSSGGWKEAKDKGKVRLEGRDYVVQDKDVIEFKVGG
jgi:hypothetical protein